MLRKVEYTTRPPEVLYPSVAGGGGIAGAPCSPPLQLSKIKHDKEGKYSSRVEKMEVIWNILYMAPRIKQIVTLNLLWSE